MNDVRTRMQLKCLKVLGLTRSYDVNFNSGLNIIAGEISTGKTTILQLVDYCLGSSHQPEHIELQRKARSCLLEIVIAGTTYVFERALFSSRLTVTIHECALNSLNETHKAVEVAANQHPERESVSSFVLKRLGLWDIELKEAPSKEDSGTDRLSLRDLMWFCFLPSRRLDNENLLFEEEYMKALKFRQVFDVLFGLHGNKLAALGRQISRLNAARSSLDGDIKTLSAFLGENQVPTADDLQATRAQANAALTTAEAELQALAVTQRSDTEVAQPLRLDYSAATSSLKTARARKRDQESLLQRLLPLRGQYAEEIKKLRFLQESKRVFDPLGVTFCPACGSDLHGGGQSKDECFLCHATLVPAEEEIDVEREIRSLDARLKELNQFVDDTGHEILQLTFEIERTSSAAMALQQRLDDVVKNFVSPSLARRDELVGQLHRSRQQLSELDGQLRFWHSLSEKQSELARVQLLLNEKQAELELARENLPDRKAVIEEFSALYGEALRGFEFPKLSNPKIDDNLIPHVRGLVYRKLGSNGAFTLTALAWYMSMFSLALHRKGHHPGFLMIDSPQKNIGAHNRYQADVEEEYRDDAIVRGIYESLLAVCREHQEEAQLIVVDNAPPNFVKDHVVVRYTGRSGHPPYGLIEDEEG